MPSRRTASAAAAIALLTLASGDARALREPDGRWLEIATKDLTVYSDAGESRSRTMAVQLERLGHALSGVAPALRPSHPVFVYAFGEERSFRSYARTQGVPHGVDGLSFSDATGGYVMVNAETEGDALGVIYHEYLHLVLSDNFPGMPLWLNEGLAEFFSTFWTNGYQAELGLPIASHLELLRRVDPIPLERLLVVTPDSEEYTSPALKPRFHAQSWLLTHYLIQGDPDLGARISDYLRLSGSGRDAFESAFGIDIETLEARLSAYRYREPFPTSSADFTEPYPESRTKVEEMTEEDVHYRLGVLLAHGVPEGRGMARKHLARALAIDPENAGARAAMEALRQDDPDRPRPR